MKRAFLIILTISLTTILSGQEIKFSIAPTVNNALYFHVVSGGPNHISKPGVSTTVGYYIHQDRKISFCFGLSYQFSQVKVDPFIDPMHYPAPFTESINLICFNVGAIYNFKKDYYVSLDPIIDLQLKYETEQSISKQTGLGLSCGFGKKIRIKNVCSFYIEPRLWIHNIIPFQDENIPLRLSVAGLNFGFIFGHKSFGKSTYK